MISIIATAEKRRAAERIGLFVPVIGRRLFALLVPIDHDGAQLLFARARWSARPGQIWLADGHPFRALIYARAARALFAPRLDAFTAIPTFFGNDLLVGVSLATQAMPMASRDEHEWRLRRPGGGPRRTLGGRER
uniref:Uncharacterized protein n=1 Tax=Plectus sambesii TaxID=2011161 RepID=A0A914WFC9_9BILA